MRKVLVIEDEAAIRETLSEILEFSNYQVLKAENGKAGYEMAIKSFPDIVICDVMMPQMNGLETIKAFREHHCLKFVPFIFLSALSETSDLRRGMNLGADDYLTKPFKSSELLSVIKLQLKKVEQIQRLSDTVSDYRVEKVITELTQEAAIYKKRWHDYLQSAANIQSLILPKKSVLNKIIPDNFIYFKPKYKVSGDFYWAQSFDNIKLVAVADCTGHGIAASLLTICCYQSMNLAVQHYGLRQPKAILEKVNELVLTFMQAQGKAHNEIGMDVLICSINEKEKLIHYAGANRPLYMVTKSLKINSDKNVKQYKLTKGNPLFKLRGSLFTVGSLNKRAKLTEKVISYNKGDLIYLCSDGYADQFGGPSDKCFRSNNLIQLLISIQEESTKDQKQILAENFSIWKGATEQTDDVTLLGIKL